jgi:cell division protein FtsL
LYPETKTSLQKEVIMEKQQKFSRSILSVALGTALVLSVPLVAQQFTDEVNWSVADFLVMGVLIFSAGLSYVLITRYVTNIVHKAAIVMALGSTFLMIWANLAVGLIGSGPNPGNLMYLAVIAVGFIGTFFSRFTPAGMERTLYAMALAVVLLAIIALATNMQQYAGSSVAEIIGVNGFFTVLFGISGLLFRYVVLVKSQSIEKSEG